MKQIPIFSDLNEQDMDFLKKITKSKSYKRRDFIFMEGEPSQEVYFIASGWIKTYRMDEQGHELLVSLLYKGEMFPHTAFFEHSYYPATAEVVQDADILAIANEDFRHLLLLNPHISLKIMKIMSEKIVNLQERLQELMSKDVIQRLTQLLLYFAEKYGKNQTEGIYIDVSVTHQDLANMLGTSRETINRGLNRLKKEQLISMNREGIHIFDLERLHTTYGHVIK